jgi:uncharacterized membrane protein (UPF0127 family)
MGTAMQRTYCVFNQTSKSFVALNVRRVDTVLERLNGLFRRVGRKSDEGLWGPSSGIHAVGLRGPVDLIYLDGQNCVIHLVEQVLSFRFGAFSRNSASVLKLPRHTIYSSQTRVGDQLLICLPEEMEKWLKTSIPSLRIRRETGAIDNLYVMKPDERRSDS